MSKSQRKPISDSMRWQVFARDGFCCRYCGRQAGQEGVSLAVDHVVSVADGGDNRIDNLVTACRQCNGGKSAKSLLSIPSTQEVMERLERTRADADAMSQSIERAIEAEQDREQVIVNMKCAAYRQKSCTIQRGEMSIALGLVREFGADNVARWYVAAARRGVHEAKAVRYVCGCARNERENGGAE